MKKLLLIALSVVSAASAPMNAQENSVRVEVAAGEVCPTGWATVDTPWTKAARIYYVLPSSLVVAFNCTHVGHTDSTVEFLVTQAFVTSIWPTPTQEQAAYSSGRLRAESATSGNARTCTIGS